MALQALIQCKFDSILHGSIFIKLEYAHFRASFFSVLHRSVHIMLCIHYALYPLCSVSIMLKINMQPHLSIFASKNCILGDTVGMIIQKNDAMLASILL